MNCPRCNDSLLQEGLYNQQPAALCKQCGGVLLEQKYLTRVLEKVATDLAQQVNLDYEIESIADHGPLPDCPRCSGEMQYYGYMESDKAMIDYCGACNMLWIDPLEFAVMAQMYRWANQKQGQIRNQHYEPGEILEATSMSLAMTRVMMVGFTGLNLFS